MDRRPPRITVIYTPKHASWLDMAELWFSTLTRGLLRRGEFTSRADLAEKITSFAVRCSRTARPYTWTYDAGADHARHLARHTQHDDSRYLISTRHLDLSARLGIVPL